MLLRKIEVQHFGKFLSKAVLDGFGDQFNVLVADNESGKSTLFHAVRHLFMTNYQRGDADLRSFVPWNTSGVHPEITVEFEHKIDNSLVHFKAVKHFFEDYKCEIFQKQEDRFVKTFGKKEAEEFLRKIVSKPKENYKDADRDQSLIKLLWNIQDTSLLIGNDKSKKFFPEVEGNLKEIIYTVVQNQSLSPEEKLFQSRLQSELKKYYTNEKCSEYTKRQDSAFYQILSDLAETEKYLQSLREKQTEHELNLKQKDIYQQKINDYQSQIEYARKIITDYRQKYTQLSQRIDNIEIIKNNIETLKQELSSLSKVIESRGKAQNELIQAERTLKKLKQEHDSLQKSLEALAEQKSLLKEQRYQFEAFKHLHQSFFTIQQDYERHHYLVSHLIELKNDEQQLKYFRDQIEMRSKSLKLLENNIHQVENQHQIVDLRKANVNQLQSEFHALQKDLNRLNEIKLHSLEFDKNMNILMNQLQSLMQKRQQLEKKYKESEGIQLETQSISRLFNHLVQNILNLKSLVSQGDKVKDITIKIENLKQKINALPRISTEDFNEMKKLDHQVQGLIAKVETNSTGITFCFDSNRKISYDSGQELFLQANQEIKLSFSKSTTLYLDGVGKIQIEPTNSMLNEHTNLLESSQYKLNHFFKIYNISSLDQAYDIVEERQSLINQQHTEKQILKNVLDSFENHTELYQAIENNRIEIQEIAKKVGIPMRMDSLESVSKITDTLQILDSEKNRIEIMFNDAIKVNQQALQEIQSINKEIDQKQHEQTFLQQTIQQNKVDQSKILQEHHSENQLQFNLNEKNILLQEAEQNLQLFLNSIESPEKLDEMRQNYRNEEHNIQEDNQKCQQDLGRLSIELQLCNDEIKNILDKYEESPQILYQRYTETLNMNAVENQKIKQVIPWFDNIQNTEQELLSRLSYCDSQDVDLQQKLMQSERQMSEYVNVISLNSGILQSTASEFGEDNISIRSGYDSKDAQYQTACRKFEREQQEFHQLLTDRQHYEAKITYHEQDLNRLIDLSTQETQNLHRLEGLIEANNSVYSDLIEAEDNLTSLNFNLQKIENQAKALKLLYESFNSKINQYDQRTLELVSKQTSNFWNYLKYGSASANKENFLFNEKFQPDLTHQNSSIIVNSNENYKNSKESSKIERFSGGAIEQLNLLSRLSLIHHLIQHDSSDRHLLVLDDVMVHTDYERMKRLLQLVNRYTKYLQVVILTCQKDSYQNIFNALEIEPNWLKIQAD